LKITIVQFVQKAYLCSVFKSAHQWRNWYFRV